MRSGGRSARLTLLLLLLVLAVPAAAQTPPPPTIPRGDPDPSIRDGSAQRARKRWRRADIHTCRFELTRSCFCPQTDAPVIFVRGDRPLNPTPSSASGAARAGAAGRSCRPPGPSVTIPGMLVFALSPAASYTIAAIAVWFVIFPAFVTALIAFSIAGVARERIENEEERNRRRRG